MFILAVITSIMLNDYSRSSDRLGFDPAGANLLVEAVEKYYSKTTTPSDARSNAPVTLAQLVEQGYLAAESVEWTRDYEIEIQPPAPNDDLTVLVTLTPKTEGEPAIHLYSDGSVGVADDP